MYIVINGDFWKYGFGTYNNYYFSDEISYWFDKNLYEFYDTDEIEKLGYYAETQDELIQLLDENNIIPSYSVNLYQFDKMFIESFKNKKLNEYFSRFKDEEIFDRMFSIYTEENNIDYFDDLRKFYKDTVIEWCKTNDIRYRLE